MLLQPTVRSLNLGVLTYTPFSSELPCGPCHRWGWQSLPCAMCHTPNHLQLFQPICKHKVSGKIFLPEQDRIAFEIWNNFAAMENYLLPISSSQLLWCLRRLYVQWKPHYGLMRKAMRLQPLPQINKYGVLPGLAKVSLKRANQPSQSVNSYKRWWEQRQEQQSPEINEEKRVCHGGEASV